ncbi:hypothetical protein ASPFODRAFT_85922 [Aspergillus luchuensis CBS 106.47]|uniref:Fatty acid desaturase domain-containing protein n=1 Tax=Aspergillus luchuensis (strain CBS 106.47) TaxID=1137211 RepID=A0A1M3T0N7_ASPLC|nr:hypothetical protein ASPFODRAFT_85922 [Aspergillus luchuensis CBS 106.47]
MIPATTSDYVTEKIREGPFEPTVFTTLDLKSLQVPGIVGRILNPHIILYLLTPVPSALYLFYRFTPTRALLHWLLEIYSCGPFTLMLHNHIHNDGLLNHRYLWMDSSFPHILGPLMGHTRNSYYYHRVKHHHVENNGSEDLSSTIRYQRDNLLDILVYLASHSFLSEICSICCILCLSRYKFHATLVTLISPLVQTRIGMVVGNWGQHAFIDRSQPTYNYRSSITLIDAQSNRHCFNDGYHTSHHLNPRRHWREHPLAFLKARVKYQSQDALVFQNIDFFRITFHLTRKYCNQTRRSKLELASMLKERTRRFTENEIDIKFRDHYIAESYLHG